eukprot:TRINITY_DN24355_c0_g1_i2.p1 TRINITY_DN24355_c0_g1~~TRINITY_DN24355_c0_g1_i2.p1  ORF type:complete len:436 (+),score=33.92 TRINITY_DN24355_c0_g1_i2:28-1308(+)
MKRPHSAAEQPPVADSRAVRRRRSVLVEQEYSSLAHNEDAGRILHLLRTEKGPREVFLWFFLDRVNEVDTVKQEFEIELVFSARWLEPCPAENVRASLEDTKWTLQNFAWDPRIKFVNIVSQTVDQAEDSIEVLTNPDFETVSPCEYLASKPSSVWIRSIRRVKASFAEKMDFRNFPFDMQKLTITLASQLPSSEVILRFCDRDKCADRMAETTHLQEFKFFSPRLIAYEQPGILADSAPLLSKPGWSRAGRQFSWLHIAPVIVRYAAPYMRSIALPQLLLVSMSFVVFLVPPSDISNRLDIDVNLILATITFRMVVSDQVPKNANLTWLGAYCLLSLLFLGLVVMENAVANILELTAREERPFIACLGLCWMLLNTCCACHAWRYLQWRDRYCLMTTQLFDKHQKMHSGEIVDDEFYIESPTLHS